MPTYYAFVAMHRSRGDDRDELHPLVAFTAGSTDEALDHANTVMGEWPHHPGEVWEQTGTTDTGLPRGHRVGRLAYYRNEERERGERDD